MYLTNTPPNICFDVNTVSQYMVETRHVHLIFCDDVNDIYCDNQSCVKMKENLVFHDKSKHREIKLHYTQYMVQKGVVWIQYVPRYERVVDILTKHMPCVSKISLV